MTAAANKLNTTQPTISQRIRALEEHLGCPLFDRKGGRLTLNTRGEAFYEELTPGLARLCGAVSDIRRLTQALSPVISIAAGAGFTHMWLRPRLERLEKTFPNRTFRLLPIDRDEAPEMQKADIALRFGPTQQDDVTDTLVVPERAFPVCSPEYASQHNLSADLDTDTLKRITLLHLDMRDPRWLDWASWCRLAHLSPPPIEKAFPYNNFPLLLNAVINHQGVGLGWSHVIKDMLDSGQLVALGPDVKRQSHGYRLNVRNPNSAVIAPIVSWLEREFAG
jgi:DNA-binding transcriptional LysR family regulator